MKRLLLIPLILALAAGCAGQLLTKGIALVLPDAQSAQVVLTNSAPLLPPNDPWLPCMKTMEQMLLAIQAGPASTVPGQPTLAVLTEASRLHVLDAMLSNMSSNPGQATCSQIILSIQLRAAAGATPGGALLPLR
jgi:hypothetical protein